MVYRCAAVPAMWESRNFAGGHAVLRSAAWRREINGPGCRPSRHLASADPKLLAFARDAPLASVA
jgi:hypothetical protein